MRKYMVVEKWTESYQNPIILKTGDKVVIDLSIKEPDVEWANWVWCTSTTQMDGWVPTQILKVMEDYADNRQGAVVIEDYSAYELSVNKDDIVIGTKVLNGWLWCRKENSGQEGWVPLRNVKLIAG